MSEKLLSQLHYSIEQYVLPSTTDAETVQLAAHFYFFVSRENVAVLTINIISYCVTRS